MTAELFAAYDATGTVWQHGPGRIYYELAAVVVERGPALDQTSLVLDLGADTGAAARGRRSRGTRRVVRDTRERLC